MCLLSERDIASVGGWEGDKDGREQMNLKRLIELLEQLVNNKFYGELLIKFESGNIVICKKTESIKG